VRLPHSASLPHGAALLPTPSMKGTQKVPKVPSIVATPHAAVNGSRKHASVFVHAVVHTPPRSAGKQRPLVQSPLVVQGAPSPRSMPPPSPIITQRPAEHASPPAQSAVVVHSGPAH